MSDLLIFVVGVVVFLVTVFGTVMAGGIRLTRNQLRRNPDLREGVADEDVDSPLMTDVEY